MKYHIWHSCIYEPGKSVPAGGLALFCTACPQPGVNLLENWEDDPDRWEMVTPDIWLVTDTMGYSFIYTRQVVYDGNFSAKLYKPKFPKDNVQLTNGTGFMVGEK